MEPGVWSLESGVMRLPESRSGKNGSDLVCLLGSMEPVMEYGVWKSVVWMCGGRSNGRSRGRWDVILDSNDLRQ